MQIEPVKAIYNSNITTANGQNPIQNNAVQAVAAPTPVISGAPIETLNQNDSVEISNQGKDKKNKGLFLTFLFGFIVAGLSFLSSRKMK